MPDYPASGANPSSHQRISWRYLCSGPFSSRFVPPCCARGSGYISAPKISPRAPFPAPRAHIAGDYDVHGDRQGRSFVEPGRLVPEGLRENAAGSRPVRRVPSETRCSFGRSFRRKFPAGPGRKHQNGILALNCHCRVISGYVVDAPAAATKRAAGFARNPTHRARSGGVSPEPPSPSPGSNPAGSIA